MPSFYLKKPDISGLVCLYRTMAYNKKTFKHIEFSTGVEMDFPLSKNLALGIGISYTGVKINDVVIETGNSTIKERLDEEYNLSRFDFSAGIRF